MNFYEKAGKMAIGSRLRRLSENITEDAARVYHLYDIDMQPKWFPLFYVLSQQGRMTITEIAQEIGHSHPSVSQMVREMVKAGMVREMKDARDGRKNVIVLDKAGEETAEKIKEQYLDVHAAIEQALRETRHDLWKAIAEWEFLLSQKTLLARVQEQKKLRERKKVQIVDYTPAYQADFKRLNEAWITRYFKMEEADHKALDHPQEYILDKGGYIFMALYEGKAAGAIALIKMSDERYELAKMAVDLSVQGKGIGWLLGQAVVEKARALGAKSLYVESNTVLAPAINLYHKMGFQKIIGAESPYERCNIQMERDL